MFGAVTAKLPATPSPLTAGATSAQKPPLVTVPEFARRIYAQAKTSPQLEKPKKKKESATGSAVITKRSYPIMVELRIAGRSYREIADRLDTSERQVRLHLASAMAAYRNGRLRIRNGESVEEARRVGEERAELGFDEGAVTEADFTTVDNAAGITGLSIRI